MSDVNDSKALFYQLFAQNVIDLAYYETSRLQPASTV